jgi:hypothetical protein
LGGGWHYSIRFPVDARTGFIAGEQGRIYATADGGTSWQKQTIFPPTTRTLRSVWFPTDNQTGYAVGDYGTILKTTDGGPSWVEETPEIRGQRLEVKFKATPNPFTTFASVPGHERERFALYDITGRQVGIYRGDQVGVGLPPGVYFLKTKDVSSPPVRIVKVR